MRTNVGRIHCEEAPMWLSTVGLIVTLSILMAPRVANAQPAGKMLRFGLLHPLSLPIPPNLRAFWQGLRDLGYIEGQNLVMEFRGAEGRVDRLPDLAAELARFPVAVIFAVGPAALQAAKQATDTLPIVALDLESDPVQSGYAASLGRPGGTITGVFLDMPGLVGKWLELLTEVVPRLGRVTVLWDPTTGPVQREAAHAAARVLALHVHTFEVREAPEFASAFAAATRTLPDALLLLGSPLMHRHSKLIADWAATSRLPAISPFRAFAEAGGLMAYGPSQPELFRRCGVQVGKILQGAKPGDLPIERPTKFELVINLKTAKALGLTIPPTFLFRADEVLQ